VIGLASRRPIQPCARFFRTRLTDIVRRDALHVGVVGQDAGAREVLSGEQKPALKRCRGLKAGVVTGGSYCEFV
jgi:hypothetical protein